jgi:prevent-host-death family protein
MNVVSSTVLRNNLSDTLKEVANNKKYLLVSKKGKPVSALVNLDFFEDLLALTNKKYINSIKEAREQFKKGEVYTHEEVFGEI